MKKVFVVNHGCHDLSDAERFGELVFLSEGAINRYAVSNMYREFVQYLKDSNKEDFLLITGLSIMSSLACSIFARMHGRINLLLYKASRTSEVDGHYIERTVMFDELLPRRDNNEQLQS